MPMDLCICDSLAKEGEKIKVYFEKRRFSKEVTIVDNIQKDMNPELIAKKLKQKLACGGTYKDGKIMLQGNHVQRAKKILIELGFPEDQIQ